MGESPRHTEMAKSKGTAAAVGKGPPQDRTRPVPGLVFVRDAALRSRHRGGEGFGRPRIFGEGCGGPNSGQVWLGLAWLRCAALTYVGYRVKRAAIGGVPVAVAQGATDEGFRGRTQNCESRK